MITVGKAQIVTQEAAPPAPTIFGGHATLGTDVVAYWKCDDNGADTAVLDSHTDSRNGIASANTNTIQTGAGPIDGALDVTVQTIDLSAIEDNPGDVFDLDKAFSVQFWVKLTNVTAWYAPLGTCLWNGVDNGWLAVVQAGVATSKLWVEFYDGGGGGSNMQTTSGATLITAGVWEHVVITYDGLRNNNPGTSLTVYVGGADCSANRGDAIAGDIHNSDLLAGELNDGNMDMPGEISEIGIWSKELTPGEVADLWNGGAGLAYD